MQFGITASADDINRLAIAGPASLLNHDGAGHQLKINKAAADQTAGLVFQSEFEGHAELGLAGKTDFSLRVSVDGSNFQSAMVVQASDGCVGIGSTSPRSKLYVEGAVKVASVGISGMPDAAEIGEGGIIYINDFSSGILAFSDGANWRSVRNRSII